MRTLKQLQEEVEVWSQRNFGTVPVHQPLLGIVEEVGELSHAHLKAEQRIRGTLAEHRESAKDAIGDIVVFLADYCRRNGYNFQACVDGTWDKVKQRDWVTNPVDADKQ